MLALLQPYLPYLLPLVLVALNEIIAHNPQFQSNSLIALIINTVVAALKAAIGANPAPVAAVSSVNPPKA